MSHMLGLGLEGTYILYDLVKIIRKQSFPLYSELILSMSISCKETKKLINLKQFQN